jgi:hypothetical protein
MAQVALMSCRREVAEAATRRWRRAGRVPVSIDPPNRIDRLDPPIDAFARRYNTYRPNDARGPNAPKAYLKSRQAEETLPSHMC